MKPRTRVYLPPRKPSIDRNVLLGAKKLFERLDSLEIPDKIATINEIRRILHRYSPFASEPVDCVLWVESERVQSNDYNPNRVAPPEMELLKHSIDADGYTQPIVAWKNAETRAIVVVDGFHRYRVGKECPEIRSRIRNYLPVSVINPDRTEREDRIASTIRHNRARGKHHIEGMSDIVVELKRRNWKDERICRELGMDLDEVLRLCQITGISDLFSDQEFSKSWDIEDSVPDFIPLTEEFDLEEGEEFRTVNTSDSNRIFHTYDKWECYKAGFYATSKEGWTRDQCEEAYRNFLSDIPKFEEALERVIAEWKHSCEHYLTNSSMNRIAWLGQAAMCYATGIPATYRGGFNLLAPEQQETANRSALVYLNKWLKANGLDEVEMEEALSGKQMELY